MFVCAHFCASVQLLLCMRFCVCPARPILIPEHREETSFQIKSDMEPSLAVLLTHTNRKSKCSLSAVGYWETEENRKTACIFIPTEFIYLFTLCLSVLESCLISKGGKDIKHVMHYREHSRSAIPRIDNNPRLSLYLSHGNEVCDVTLKKRKTQCCCYNVMKIYCTRDKCPHG